MMDNANGVTGSVQMIALTGTGAVTCQSTQNDITNGVQLGLIPPLFATPLHTILQLACNAAAEGNIQRSVIELNGFETEVTSFGKRGIIANSAEQVLLTDANALISQQSH